MCKLNLLVTRSFRSSRSLLDISGLAAIPDSPRQPTTVAPQSLHVLKRPPLEGEYITVTDSSGSRVYLRQKEDAVAKVEILRSAVCVTAY